MINKNTAYRIFQLIWIYFLVTNIADFRLGRNINLIPFVHVSEIPLIKYFPFILIALFLIPIKEILSLFKEKTNLFILASLTLLLGTGYISSYLSDYPNTALGVCNRIAYYSVVLIFALAAARYFNDAKNFILKSFIYSNVLVIAGSLLDFYVPAFHDLLVNHFDRPQTFNSVVKLSGAVIMRPMGFLTDSNLTAFSLSIALILLLLNYKQFNRIFRYSFYALCSFCIGMLASRAGLLICIISFSIFLFTKLVEKKELYIFFSAFVIFQLITPQTYYRFYTLFDKKQNRMEFSTGRFLLWETAFTVFKENPVIGAGPGVFFILSDDYIRKSIIEKDVNKNINIYKPGGPDYFKIDKKNPHNIFLVMLAETGLIGFIIFTAMVIILSAIFIKKNKFMSLLFLINFILVSSVSNFAPYYRFYLVMCIVFLVLSKQDMFVKQKKKFSDVKKILIFKLCCFGDAVFITPALKSLRENFPDAKIIYAHSRWISSLMNYMPEIDGDIPFSHIYSLKLFEKISGAFKFIYMTRKENFDLVLFGHRANQLSFIVWLCGIKYRIGFEGTKYLTHTGKFRKDLPEYLRYQNLLSENGLKTFDSPPELKNYARNKIRDLLGIKSSEKLLGIFPMGGYNPGTKMDIKLWDLTNYFKLTELINHELPGLRIIIFQGKMNFEKITLPEGVNAELQTIDNDFISACDYFVSGDTGSLHIAAAMGVSTLAIYGPSNPLILAPVNFPGKTAKHIYIWKKPACSPCYNSVTALDKSNSEYWDDHRFLCHTGTHECMKSISPHEVFDELKNLLKFELVSNETG